MKIAVSGKNLDFLDLTIIALHHAGKPLKPCQADPEKQDENFPITLKIMNSQTEEILVKLSVVFDNKNYNQAFAAERK